MLEKYPSELEMLETFGTEPLEAAQEDGFWQYSFCDTEYTQVLFSFNIFESSVQTIVKYKSRTVSIVSFEGDGVLRIDRRNGYPIIDGDFQQSEYKTRLIIHIEPLVEVKWSTMKR